MIRAIRRSRLARSVATFGLWAVLSVIVTAELHHGADDPECQATTGGGSAATLVPAVALTPDAQVQHCLICHAFQSARAEQDGGPVSPSPTASPLPAPVAPLALQRLFASATPARAPPTA